MSDDPYADRGFVPPFHIPPSERVKAPAELVRVLSRDPKERPDGSEEARS